MVFVSLSLWLMSEQKANMNKTVKMDEEVNSTASSGNLASNFEIQSRMIAVLCNDIQFEYALYTAAARLQTECTT